MAAELLVRPAHPLRGGPCPKLEIPSRDLGGVKFGLERLGHQKKALPNTPPGPPRQAANQRKFHGPPPSRRGIKHPVPRRFILPLALGLLLFPAGCGKKGPPILAEKDDPWAVCAFARHIPASSEGFFWCRHPAESWRDLAGRAAPLLEPPGLPRSWQGTSPGRIFQAWLEAPRTPEILTALGPVDQGEIFLALGAGSGSQLAALQQVKRLFAVARLRNLFTPLPAEEAPPEEIIPLEALPEDLAAAAFTEVITPLAPAMQEALEKFVREAVVPPLLLGAKLPPDSPLPGLLETWAASLPEKIPRDRVEAGEHGEFTRLRLPLTLLVPTNVAVRTRDILAANLGDPYAATYLVRDLLAKVTTLGFGQMHGYFVISIGTDSGRPTLAAGPADALPSTPVMQRLEPLLTAGADTVFYADPLVVSLAAAPPPVTEYLEAALEAALEFAPAETIDPLRAQAAPLRMQAADLFRPRVSAVGGLARYEANTWRAEIFGGSLAPRLALANAAPLLRPETGVDLFWTENWEAGYVRRLTDFSAGLATFAAAWTKALGPVFLDEQGQATVKAFLHLAAGPLEQLKSQAGPLLEAALGTQVALAVAFAGSMPPPPLLPPAAAQASLPRVALAAALRDRAALSRGWEAVTQAGETARWPAPVAWPELGGAVTYAYPLPLGGPDLGLAVTIDGNRWLLGNSRAFNLQVAASPPAAAGRDAVQAGEFQTAPLATFAAAWATALDEDPSLAGMTAGLIPTDPQILSAAAEVLKTPRRFRYEARWEQEMLHRVLELAPVP